MPVRTRTDSQSDPKPCTLGADDVVHARRDAGRQAARELSLRWLKLRRRMKARFGLLEPLRIDVYGGYAGNTRAMVWGRALEDELPSAPSPDDTPLDNLRRSLRQLESDEVPGLHLQVQLAGQKCHVVTDSEGYFYVELPLPRPLGNGWEPVRTIVVDNTIELSEGIAGSGRVLVPNTQAQFGIVSDIDDTILQSHVRNRFKQAYLTLFGNAITRLSYEGTTRLYTGLRDAGNRAPFFYVSRSAWNIHALLEHFIRHQGLPEGPLVLRDVDLFNHPEKRRGHKRRELERIFAAYPELKFVLIGDSGQSDPLIYADMATRHPGRVRAILLRNVSPPRDARRVLAAMQQKCPASTPYLLFDHASAAAEKCRELGLWQQPAVHEQQEESDSQPPAPEHRS